MQKILIGILDAQLFLLLRHVVANEGFDAVLVTAPRDVPLADREKVAAVLIDWSALGIDREGLLAAVRQTCPVAGVIAFSRDIDARQETMPDCDVVLQHPFDPASLVNFLRRLRYERLVAEPAAIPQNQLCFADVDMNLATLKVHRGGQPVPLTALQFRLLRRLLHQPTVVRDRDDLIKTCWPNNAAVEPRTVDIHIAHIRRALMDLGPDLIRTVRGRGYALECPAGEGAKTLV